MGKKKHQQQVDTTTTATLQKKSSTCSHFPPKSFNIGKIQKKFPAQMQCTHCPASNSATHKKKSSSSTTLYYHLSHDEFQCEYHMNETMGHFDDFHDDSKKQQQKKQKKQQQKKLQQQKNSSNGLDLFLSMKTLDFTCSLCGSSSGLQMEQLKNEKSYQLLIRALVKKYHNDDSVWTCLSKSHSSSVSTFLSSLVDDITPTVNVGQIMNNNENNTLQQQQTAMITTTTTTTEEEEGKQVVRGLMNLGNSCFFNSVMQCMAHTRPLLAHFLPTTLSSAKWNETKSNVDDTKNSKKMNDDEKKQDDNDGTTITSTSTREVAAAVWCGPLSLSLKLFYEDYYSNNNNNNNNNNSHDSQQQQPNSNATMKKVQKKNHFSSTTATTTVVNPVRLFKQVIKIVPTFRGYQQQDAQEFLRFFTSFLCDEFSSRSNNNNNNKDEKMMMKNVIQELFQCEQSSCITCMNCKKSSRITEPIFDVSIPIPNSPTGTSENDNGISESEEEMKREIELIRKLKNEYHVEHLLDPVPIQQYLLKRNGRSNNSSCKRMSIASGMTTIEQCLWNYVKSEVLMGDNGYLCDYCSSDDHSTTIIEQTTTSTSSVTSDVDDDVSSETTTGSDKSSTVVVGDDDDQNRVSDTADDDDDDEKKETTAQDDETSSNNKNNKKKEEHETSVNSEKTKQTRIKRTALKQLSFHSCPRILTIHLKRFVEDKQKRDDSSMLSMGKKNRLRHSSYMSGGGFRKDDTRVEMSRRIMLRPFLSNDSIERQKTSLDDEICYRLYGIVEHSGSMNSGHYVAYVRRQTTSRDDTNDDDDDEWCYMSDSKIVPGLKWDQVRKAQAYIAFYERL